MKLPSFLKTEEGKECLVLDFGDSSVKGLVLEKKLAKLAIKKFDCQEIERFGVFDSFSSKSPQEETGLEQGQDFQLKIIKNSAMKVIENLGVKKRLSSLPVIAGLPPGMVGAWVCEVFIKREQESKRISKEERNQLCQNVFSQAQIQFNKAMQKRYGQGVGDFKIFKQLVLEEKISGYRVQSLLGFRGKDLVFRVLIIFVSRSRLGFIKSLLIDSLQLKEPQVCHEVEGLINFQRKRRDISQLFLDVGCQSTRIFYFEKEIQFVDEFPLGGRDFSKAILEVFMMKEKESEILKKRFSKMELSPEMNKKLEGVMSSVVDLWLAGLREGLKRRIKTFVPVSGGILIYGGGSLLPSIKKAVKEEKSADKTFGDNVDVDYLEVEKLGLENKAGKKLSLQATPIALLSLAFLEESVFGSSC